MINIDYLLQLWLGTVPEYTSQFLMLALIAALIDVMARPLVTALQATGRIKVFQIVICIIMLCELPLAYVILHYGGKPYWAMYPTILVTFVGLFARFLILKRMIPAYEFYSFIKIVGRNLLIGIICFFVSDFIRGYYHLNFINFILTSLFAFLLSSFVIYPVGLSKSERMKLVTFVRSKINVRI